MPRARPDATRTRRTLSRDRVLDAAIAMADAEGIEALSMRRLARAVGVEAMSLYNHVASKDDLLGAMLERVVAAIELPGPGEPWRDAMRRRYRSARQVLGRHPWAAVLLESRGDAGPARLGGYESTLGCLRRAGFSVELAHRAFLTLDSHLYGYMLQEQAWPTTTPEETAGIVEALTETLPAERYPYLRELLTTRVIRTGPADAEAFSFGLDLILDGLERAREGEASGRRPGRDRRRGRAPAHPTGSVVSND
jgi:AcrR family transcriptional regulator